MKKKYLFLILCAALTLAGCGDKDDAGVNIQAEEVPLEDESGEELVLDDVLVSDNEESGQEEFTSSLVTEGENETDESGTDENEGKASEGVSFPGEAFDIIAFVEENGIEATEAVKPDTETGAYVRTGFVGARPFLIAYYGSAGSMEEWYRCVFVDKDTNSIYYSMRYKPESEEGDDVAQETEFSGDAFKIKFTKIEDDGFISEYAWQFLQETHEDFDTYDQMLENVAGYIDNEDIISDKGSESWSEEYEELDINGDGVLTEREAAISHINATLM